MCLVYVRTCLHTHAYIPSECVYTSVKCYDYTVTELCVVYGIRKCMYACVCIHREASLRLKYFSYGDLYRCLPSSNGVV